MEKKVPLADCLAKAKETKDLLVGPNALEAIPELLKKYYDQKSVFVIADENTYAASGYAVQSALDRAGIPLAGSFLFGKERIHADYSLVETIREKLQAVKTGFVPLALGSGTINDLVKRAAFECRLPYFCVATAASVDGFTANGAALVYEEFKQTLPCGAPLVVLADSSVLVRAPAYLTSSGVGDLAGKLIGGSDWIIAGKTFSFDGKGELAPGSEAIDPVCWAMVQNGLLDTVQAAIPAVQGDSNAVKHLFEALAVTGFAIQHYKTSSRPGSGSEHILSHIWEMQNLSVGGIPVTHGHKVAMGTLAASAFTECFFAGKEPPRPAPSYTRPTLGERKAEVRRAFEGLGKAGDAALKTAVSKFQDDKAAAELTERLRDCWKELRDKCLVQLPRYEQFRSMLNEAQCPVIPETINLTRKKVLEAAVMAQMIRRRYTVLDYAWDLGVFNEVLKRIEESDIYLR